MRIALVYDAAYPWVPGGAERRFHELGRRLAARHEVTFVSWQWWEGPSTLRQDGITYIGVGQPPQLYGADGKRTVREALSFAARVVPVLLRNRWDVVDCSATPYLPLYGAWLATRLTRTPLVVTWHEFWGAHWLDYLPERPVVARVARLLEAGARRLGDRVVAVSPFTLERMKLSPSRASSVIGNGVDAPVADTDRADREVDVAFVGRLIDEKRADLIVDAIATLRDRGRLVRCVIAGRGPEREALRARCATLGLGELVSLPGAIEDAERDRLLRSARTYVMPSAREGFGMGVIEAQAHGAIPIVARGPDTAAAGLVQAGIDGLVVDPSAAAIADAVAGLLDDPVRQSAMRRAAIASAVRHDWDSIVRLVEDAYLAQAGPARSVAAAT